MAQGAVGCRARSGSVRAEALRSATDDLARREQDVEDLLILLFPGWYPRFPSHHGWRFTRPHTIDVYGVVDSPAAVDALHRAGFGRVTLHDHAVGQRCGCGVRSDGS